MHCVVFLQINLASRYFSPLSGFVPLFISFMYACGYYWVEWERKVYPFFLKQPIGCVFQVAYLGILITVFFITAEEQKTVKLVALGSICLKLRKREKTKWTGTASISPKYIHPYIYIKVSPHLSLINCFTAKFISPVPLKPSNFSSTKFWIPEDWVTALAMVQNYPAPLRFCQHNL